MSSLYRRRRVAAVVLSVALVVGASVGVLAGLRVLAGGPGSGSLTAPAAASSAEPAANVASAVSPAATAHVVREGDTLWGIARDITPVGGDVSAIVDHLVARNGGVVSLQPGMRLLLD